MRSMHLAALLPLLALLAASELSMAQPAAGKGARDERKERLDERQKRRDERKERRNERAEDKKERADSRRERRRERMEELRARYGRLIAEPAVAAELRVHARRMARLNTMRRLAEKEGKTALIPRIDKLIAKERARHQRHMDALKSRGAPAPSASASYGRAQ